jgi:hypothetical protein
MASWGRLLIAALVAPAAGCSLLIDSDVGVRSDGGSGGDGDGAPSGDGSGASSDAPVCPEQELPAFPPFSDDFANDDMVWAIDPDIQRDGAGAIVAGVSGGALTFKPAAAGSDSAWSKSVEFSFLEGRVAVRIPTLTTDADTQAYFSIIGPGAVHRMRFDGSQLEVPGGSSIGYVGDVHVWWQIRAQDNYFHYETSPDGILWSELDSTPIDFDITQTRIQLGIEVAAAGSSERGQLTFDDLNLTPCGAE